MCRKKHFNINHIPFWSNKIVPYLYLSIHTLVGSSHLLCKIIYEKKSSTKKKKKKKSLKKSNLNVWEKKNCVWSWCLLCLLWSSKKKIVFDHDAYCVFIYDRIIEKIERKKLVICATSKKKAIILLMNKIV